MSQMPVVNRLFQKKSYLLDGQQVDYIERLLDQELEVNKDDIDYPNVFDFVNSLLKSLELEPRE